MFLLRRAALQTPCPVHAASRRGWRARWVPGGTKLGKVSGRSRRGFPRRDAWARRHHGEDV